MKILDCLMDNTLAWRLGGIARAAAADKKAGDLIDTGLILRRLLEEAGFGLVRLTAETFEERSLPPETSWKVAKEPIVEFEVGLKGLNYPGPGRPLDCEGIPPGGKGKAVG